MSDLIVNEIIGTEMVQQIKATRSQAIQAIRPHIYRHRRPAGSLTIELRDAAAKVFATSNTIAISSLVLTGGADQDFVHSYFQFDIDASVRKDQVFSVALVASGGYTFAELAYVGWCRDFDLRKYTANYGTANGIDSALDMEIWTFRDRGRQR